MKQQVNLYLSEFRVKKDSLTPLLMGQVLAGIAITMVAVTALNYFMRWQVSTELADLEKILIEETRKTNRECPLLMWLHAFSSCFRCIRLGRLFERFFRCESTGAEGTGLGLTM